MNIRDVNVLSNRLDPYKSAGISQAGKPDEALAARNQTSSTQAVAQDRVEISDAARAAAENTKANEINFARKALLGIPPLSEHRAADLLKRIQEGYYSQPEVLKQVAASVAPDLLSGGNTPTE